MKKLLAGLILVLSVGAQASDKNWNVRVDPLTLLVGGTNVELDYAIADKISIGGGLVSWNVDLLDVEISMQEYHVRGDYWFNGAFQQGWYVSGVYSTISMELATIDSLNTRYEADVSASGFKLLGGYHWQWDSFNLELGFGYVSYSFDDKLTLEAADGSTLEEDLPNVTGTGLEFNMGWAF